MRRWWLVGIALVIAASASPVSSQSSGSCSTVQHEITSDCGGLCDVCVVFDAAADCTNCVTDGQDTCQYLCFHAADFTVAVTIGFGEYQSNEEVEARKTDSNYDVEVAAVSYGAEVSNDNVSVVGPLTLSSNVTELVIAGGNKDVNYVKGKVVSVNFDSDFNSSLLVVILASINLGDTVDKISSLVPPAVWRLELPNCLLTQFPSNVNNMSSLTMLNLTGNYITNIDSVENSFITDLYLADNNITSFDGSLFSKLYILSLNNNALTAIPKSLPNILTLVQLYLDGNFIRSVEATISSQSLQILSLRNNSVETFEAVFPQLDSLYFGYHNFSKIPDRIYEQSDLRVLEIQHGEQKVSSRINQTQFGFLYNLGTFYVTQDDLDSTESCEGSLSNLTGTSLDDNTVANVTFCVVAAESGSSSSAQTPSQAASSSGESSVSSTGVKPGLVAGVVAGAVVILLVGVYLWRKNISKSRMADQDANSVPLWKDNDMLKLLLRPEDIQDVKKIGSGAWGDVWLVKYRDSQLCAAKRLRKDHTTKDTNRAFADEIKLVAKFDHPNIVRLIGAAWTVATDLQALFEYMEGGDLRDYLVDASTPREWTPQKVRIATDVIDALVYVHSFDPPVVHRDLKSRNVLLSTLSDEEAIVSGELRAKLTDFGSSRYKSLEDTMTRGVGTARWLAPEVLSSRSYGPSADIFSFGVVLSELDTHALPYDGECSSDGSPLSDVAILQKVAMGTLRPRFGVGCPIGLRELADRCLSVNADDRPHAPEIAYALRTMARGLDR